MHERFDVVVIGAGPPGSATPSWVAAASGSVLLADRAPSPRESALTEFFDGERLLGQLSITDIARALDVGAPRRARPIG